MKGYLLVDLIGDYKNLMSYKGLKYMVIDKITEDTLENIGDEGIVRCNIEKLDKLAKNEPTMKFIREELESYSYKIIDLVDLVRDLEDAKQYYSPNELKPLAYDFKSVIETIERGFNNENK